MTFPLAATFPARTLLIMAGAAFIGIAMWLYAPAFNSVGSGDDGSAALPASLQVDGTVEVTAADNMVSRLVVPLSVRGDERILLTEGRRLHASTFMSDTAAAAVPAQYSLAWLDGNGDEFLDPGEHAVLTVDLPVPSPVSPENPMELIIRPVDGVPLVIRDVLP
jgi:hypothetical protein